MFSSKDTDTSNAISPDSANVDNIIADNNVVNNPNTDSVPSANENAREGNNSKKIQLVGAVLAGLLIMLVGLGLAVKRYQKVQEEKRIEEAEVTAQQQKKMAETGNIDISKDQEAIKSNEFQNLPPPAALDDNAMAGNALPPLPPPQQQTYIEPVKPTPKYSEDDYIAKNDVTPYVPPAPAPSPAPFMPVEEVPSKDETVIANMLPVEVKGANSSVLVDVGKLAIKATAASNNADSKVGANLKPTVLANSKANRRGDTSLMLLKGTTIPCVLKTKIDSTYQGFTVCQISRDVYSANGKTLLLERGSQVFGEQNVQIKRGQARVAVLWNRVDTPKGVSVNINSPATGQLGEMGIDAEVNTHFWERFGAAIMLSIIQDAIKAGTERLKEKNKEKESSTTINNTSKTTQSMAEKALDTTINIPPTATVNQGSVINIMVVRDVDFSGVYKLLHVGNAEVLQ